MPNKDFYARISPRRGPDYLDKLFLSKNVVNDFLNGSPSEFHMYIPVPNEKYPNANVQFWVKGGTGTAFVRFENPVALGTTLRTYADIVTSDLVLDRFMYAEDLARYL